MPAMTSVLKMKICPKNIGLRWSQRLRHDSATKRQRQRRGDRQWAVRLIFLRTLDGRGSRQLGEASVTAPGAGGATKAQRSRHCGPSPRAPPSCSPASPNSSLASVSPSADAQQRQRGLKSLCPLVKMAGTSHNKYFSCQSLLMGEFHWDQRQCYSFLYPWLMVYYLQVNRCSTNKYESGVLIYGKTNTIL